ncbi:MAG: response regulator, partial [Betaproteobacteria bacterium]
NTIEANTRTEDLLKQSQSLAHELQSRQQELQQTNQELEEKAGLLAHQNQEVERKNQEVEQARKALEEKAEQLALTSKYKSEFLANMSHELRTPLNSLLILSDQLCKNPGGNLTGRQVEFAKTIHASGNDLLTLINDILDLSKIESGTVVVDPTDMLLDDLRRYVERTFRHVAEAKSLDFRIQLDTRLPQAMFADTKRLQQVLKNLLSNAFKFTQHGHVTMAIESVKSGWDPGNEMLNRADDVIAFSVEDTGIGISADKQQIIFEAFQQADGSTSRKYGGTGLGLAISRELTRLLGGEIRLVSEPRVGSTFTLYMPQIYTPPRARKSIGSRIAADAQALLPLAAVQEEVRILAPVNHPAHTVDEMEAIPAVNALVNEVGDDRDRIRPGDSVLLIVENDLGFARFLLDAAREKGFKGIVSTLGVAALAVAIEYRPCAITLDIYLPDIGGWRVLDRLKHDPQTRHIPVTVISTDESRARALQAGAYAFVGKPIQGKEVVDELLDKLTRFTNRPRRNVLVVAPDKRRRDWLSGYLSAEDLAVVTAKDGHTATAHLTTSKVDCVVATPDLPEKTVVTLRERLQGEGAQDAIPVIVYSEGGGLGGWAGSGARAVIREVRSPERLLDLASFFLHRDPAKMPESHRNVLRGLHQSIDVLKGKKAMIVDDDMRNIFALSSLLEEQGMAVISHDNGRDAVRSLQTLQDVDVVLMDIMMPEMDGIDTIREIRRIPACKDLPIIAVTAKAMKGDREKCIEAGAWDYLSKPVDTDLMVGTLRGWLATGRTMVDAAPLVQ